MRSRIREEHKKILPTEEKKQQNAVMKKTQNGGRRTLHLETYTLPQDGCPKTTQILSFLNFTVARSDGAMHSCVAAVGVCGDC